VAFATVAGMPPEYGLYAAIVPAIIGALFGSSYHLVTGPSTTSSLIIFASLSVLAAPGSPDYIRLALTLAFLTGVFQLVLGLVRMGVLVDFVPPTVIVGYVAGAAVWIFCSQLGNFFGVAMPHGVSLFELFRTLWPALPDIGPYVVAVGAATLLGGIAVRRFFPRVPYMIVAMVIGTLFALLLNSVFGEAQTAIKTVGAISSPLPPLSNPDLSWKAIQNTWFSALVITLLSLTEAISIARAIAMRTDQVIDNNQTFVGQGLANVIGSFFSAYPSSGSFNRSALNHAAGAQTPRSGVFATAFLIVLLALFGPLAADLPITAMAAILFMVAWGLIDLKQIRIIVRTSRLEAMVLVVTFIATLIDLRVSIFVGMFLSLAIFVFKAARPTVNSAVPNPAPQSAHFIDGDGLVADCPTLKIIRINGSLYFGAANFLQQALQQVDRDNPLLIHVLIVARGINYLDVAGAQVLAQEARRRHALGGGLYFYRLNNAAQAVLRQGGFMADIGEENLYPTQGGVVDKIKARIQQQPAAIEE
jgi:SulP family sulfate permease